MAKKKSRQKAAAPQAAKKKVKSPPHKKANVKSTRKKAAKKLGRPDTSVLERYSPTDSAASHADWVKDRFPTYITPHAGHEATAVREFTHAGHLVKIITTYRVEVDGKVVRAHLSVDEDGRVYTHATPFVTYGSAVDLMKAVIDGYPDAFSDSGDQHDHGADGRHGTGRGHGTGGHP